MNTESKRTRHEDQFRKKPVSYAPHARIAVNVGTRHLASELRTAVSRRRNVHLVDRSHHQAVHNFTELFQTAVDLFAVRPTAIESQTVVKAR